MKKYTIALIALVLIIGSACSKSNEKPFVNQTAHLEKIAEKTTDDKSTVIEIYSDYKLTTGYNNLYIRLIEKETNKIIENAEMKLTPMMTMEMNGENMKHSSPVEQAKATADEPGFKTAAIFTMASDEHGSWELLVEIKSLNGKATLQNIAIPIQVNASQFDRVKTIRLADGSTYLVTYISPSKPKVGVNDFELAIHQRKDIMDFPADDGFTIEAEPTMPSMGHGSPNNVNPVLLSNGHYKGKINFTMTGDWKIDLLLNKGGETAATYFELLF